MGHTTVRIKEETRETLRALADAEGKPMQAILEEAIEALRRERFFESIDRGYAALRRDPAAWKSIEAERLEMDGTLVDGLEVREAARSSRRGRRRSRK